MQMFSAAVQRGNAARKRSAETQRASEQECMQLRALAGPAARPLLVHRLRRRLNPPAAAPSVLAAGTSA
jgi:hypothetical protein